MRRGLFALLIAAALLFPGLARATDSSVPAMTAATSVGGTDILYCSQSGIDKRCTPQQMSAYIFGLISGDFTCNSSGVCTVTKTNGTAFSALATTVPGTGIVTALGIAVGSAGAVVTNGGALGTPSSAGLANATGLPIAGLSGLGTGVGTALGTAVGSAGGPVVNGGALGTPSGGNLANATGLPVAGVSGLGTGVGTALGNSLSSAGGLSSTIASGATALGTGAISSGTCASVVTATATNVATTDVVTASFNGDPTAVTGYIPATTGMLAIIVYPTTGNVNFKVCNNTASSITPGAITVNWRVVR